MKKTKTKTITLTVSQYKFLLQCLDDIIDYELGETCTDESKMNKAEKLKRLLEAD